MEIRRFRNEDAIELSDRIKETLLLVNSKDYSMEFIQKTIEELSPEEMISRSQWMNL